MRFSNLQIHIAGFGYDFLPSPQAFSSISLGSADPSMKRLIWWLILIDRDCHGLTAQGDSEYEEGRGTVAQIELEFYPRQLTWRPQATQTMCTPHPVIPLPIHPGSALLIR